MPRKKNRKQSYRVRKEKERKRTAENRKKRKEMLALEQGMTIHDHDQEYTASTSDNDQPTASTSDNNQHTASTSDDNQPIGSTSNISQHTDATSGVLKCYTDVIHSIKDESDGPAGFGFGLPPMLDQKPKTYQTVSTYQKNGKKRARGRPPRYHLEWEEGSEIVKEYDAEVVQCCLCYRNLLFGCNGLKVHKKHKHFETDNIICSSCELSNANSSPAKTKPSENTYEKLEHSSQSVPGYVKPVTKVVYVVRPPSDHDKLIINKPRIYKKRRVQSQAQINYEDEPTSYAVTDEGGAASSSTNCREHQLSSTSTTHIWTQSELNCQYDYQSNYNDDDDNNSQSNDDDDDGNQSNQDDDESLPKQSTAKMFVKIGKRFGLGKSLRNSRSSRKHQEMTLDRSRSDDESVPTDDYLKTEIKKEPVDPAFEPLHSNSQFEENLRIEVKMENIDPAHEHINADSAVEQPPQIHANNDIESVQSLYVNKDIECVQTMYMNNVACINPEIDVNIDNVDPSFEISENFYQTDVNVGPVVEQPPQSQDKHVNKDLAYIYLSNQDDASMPKSSESERFTLPSDNVVAVIPVLNIKKEVETE